MSQETPLFTATSITRVAGHNRAAAAEEARPGGRSQRLAIPTTKGMPE
jgi:hypothetical protein